MGRNPRASTRPVLHIPNPTLRASGRRRPAKNHLPTWRYTLRPYRLHESLRGLVRNRSQRARYAGITSLNRPGALGGYPALDLGERVRRRGRRQPRVRSMAVQRQAVLAPRMVTRRLGHAHRRTVRSGETGDRMRKNAEMDFLLHERAVESKGALSAVHDVKGNCLLMMCVARFQAESQVPRMELRYYRIFQTLIHPCLGYSTIYKVESKLHDDTNILLCNEQVDPRPKVLYSR